MNGSPKVRSGESFRSSACYEGVTFTATGDTQAAADAMVKNEIAYQLCKRAKGLPNRLQGTL